MYFSERALELAKALVARAKAMRLTITTAESCTGGLIAACLTETPGASAVFERGFITYANAAKIDLLHVPEEDLARLGAVSEEVARAMAQGALAQARADLAVSVTGIAGPGGARPGKPVGLIHIAAARRGGKTLHRQETFAGDRHAIRSAAVEAALELLSAQADAAGTPPHPLS